MSSSTPIDYKNTLNLPHTDFPMKANLPQREPEQLKKWNEADIYQQIRKWAKGREKFILHDGPPYANGNIHLGHALNKVLKDIIIKSKTLSGYDCPYVPGWDCHGLPIEREVEKKLGRAGDKISHDDFRKACRDYAAKQIVNQKKEFVRLGVFGDWDHPYQTMNYEFEANIMRALKLIYQNGHLQKGYKPVHWCTECRSSLAEAEVEYRNKTSPSIDVKFTVVDETTFLSKFNQLNLGKGEVSVIIWTTTPWTLPANEAVALASDEDYVIAQVDFNNKPERWVVAKELVSELSIKYNVTLEILAEIKGQVLENLKLQHPFLVKQVPVVLGEHVTLDGGTGCVHTAPGHGPDDYILGLKYNLSVDHEVQGNGVFNSDTQFVGGQHVSKANGIIVELLRTNNKLVAYSDIEHSYPHCWRHKTEIIFRATPQWFISMSKENLRQNALEAIKNVKWIPDWGFARIEKMVANRPDWCISRQRTWCVPMPLYINKNTNDLHPNTAEIIDLVAETVATSGIEAWYKLDKQQVLSKFKADPADYEASTDTLDVWFDSGVTHYAVLKQNQQLAWPADLYLEGSDQHRGWFGSSLMTGVSMYGTAPYKQVLTHGYTVDHKGHKMSKSLGNIIEPQEVNNKFGTDVLRLWVASADYRGEIVVSNDIFERTSDVYRRIRNTARFLLANLHGFNPATDLVAVDKLIKLDAFALNKAIKIQEEIKSDYDNYAFRNVYQKVHDFCSIDLGSFYLDIIKDRQYTNKENSLARRSAQTAIFYIVKMLVKWIAPILSFTSEEIWQNIKKLEGDKLPDSVFLTLWDDLTTEGKKLDATEFNNEFWEKIINIRTAVNKQLEAMRAAGAIGSALQAEVVIYTNAENFSVLNKLEHELKFVLITSKASIKLLDGATEALTDTDIEGIKLGITKSSDVKCVRCWHHDKDIGANSDHPELCPRCIVNVAGFGEIRLYA